MTLSPINSKIISVLILSIVLALGLTNGRAGAQTANAIDFDVEVIPLNTKKPQQKMIGKLRYRGGVEISSSHSRFGGLSALAVSADRTDFIAISDRGVWIHGLLKYNSNGDLAGVDKLSLIPLRGPNGVKFESAFNGDAESIAQLDDGNMLISFERNHRLLIYGGKQSKVFPSPPGLSKAPSNGGIEALTTLPGNRLLAFAEDLDAGPKGERSAGWLWDKGKWSSLELHRPDGFRPTGAAVDANGDVYILFNLFSFFSGHIVRIHKIAGDSITAGAVLKGELVAEIRSPTSVDNFEGIDIRSNAAGKTFLYLISDDNFNPLQSTLLFMFEIM